MNLAIAEIEALQEDIEDEIAPGPKGMRRQSPTLITILKPLNDGVRITNDLSMWLNAVKNHILKLHGEQLAKFCVKALDVERIINTSLNARRGSNTRMRNWMRDNLEGEDLEIGLDNYHMSKDDAKLAQKLQAAQREANNAVQEIYLVSDITNLFNDVKDKDDVPSLIVLMLMCTGRRLIESVISGYAEDDDGSDDHIMFSGRAKAKGVEYPPLRIPILFLPADELLDKIILLRERIGDRFNNKANTYISATLTSGVSKILRTYLGPDAIAHTLRKIYCVLCYEKFGSEASFNGYIKDILGHAIIETSLNYSTVKVVNDLAEGYGEEKDNQ